MTSIESIVEQSRNLMKEQEMEGEFCFKCYLRTPDMKSVVYNVSNSQTVTDLKRKAWELLNLNHITNFDQILLIVNQVELASTEDLRQNLYQKAIIHVIAPLERQLTNKDLVQGLQQQDDKKIKLKIKQPPINCSVYELPQISLTLTIKQLKSKILEFYRVQEQHNELGRLEEKDLYLSYGGRVLMDDKKVGDFPIDEKGIITVINGRLYVKEMTRKEAEQRINQIKGKTTHKLSLTHKQQYQKISKQQNTIQEQLKSQPKSQKLSYQQKQQAQISNQAKQQPVQQEFNIIQNIVHDSDSQVSGQVADDLTRSQKIIQRYNSMPHRQQNQEQEAKNTQLHEGLNFEQVEEQPFIDNLEQEQRSKFSNQNIQEQAQQVKGIGFNIEEDLLIEDKNEDTIDGYAMRGRMKTFKNIDIPVDEDELTWEQKMSVGDYLSFVTQQVADYGATIQPKNVAAQARVSIFGMSQGLGSMDLNENDLLSQKVQQQTEREGQCQQESQLKNQHSEQQIQQHQYKQSQEQEIEHLNGKQQLLASQQEKYQADAKQDGYVTKFDASVNDDNEQMLI